MKRRLQYGAVVALIGIFFIACKKNKDHSDDPNTSTSFVKLHVDGRLVYETDIVNAYYGTSPISILNLTSVEDKNSGGLGPSLIFQTLAFDGNPGTIRIVHGDGNSASFQEQGRFDISNKDIDGNRGYLDVTITDMRQSGAVKVLTGTFIGRLINDKKTAIEVNGSFNDHAYPHYGE